ncbi:MAG TPA: hypothetical protein DDZ96_03475 [Porphyromonadaceae bacterium]|nr:hypothetical protein [Porphyromonadaceae bacterium]HCM20704.1 hypothetical protein [Porphyromonadaceae bacterium]
MPGDNFKKGDFVSPLFYTTAMLSKINIFFTLFFIFSCVGCTHSPETNEFTYVYSMESVNNFKVEMQLNPDSTYKIGRYDYFFDKYEGKSKPAYKEGTLKADEFDAFRSLIQKSELARMKDAYGFEEGRNSDNAVIYMIQLTQGGKTKFITVKAGSTEFPEAFNRLVKFSGNFMNEKLME